MNLRQLKRKYWYPISVDLEIKKRKFCSFIDRLYLKVWYYIFAFFIVFWVFIAYTRMSYDYALLQNYANLDAPFQPCYTSWNTDGSPGQDPPK
jgi:hypothetical protein